MEAAGNGTLKLPGVTTPQEALKFIYLDAPNVENATVYTDPHSRRECGLYRYLHIEPDALGIPEKTQRLERVFVADANDSARGNGRPGIRKGETVLQIIEAGLFIGPLPVRVAGAPPADKVIAEVIFPCGGHSLMFEARRPLVFTDAARRLQRSVNLLNTLLAINAIFAGFRSRDYFNATQPRGEDGGEVVNGPSQAMFWYSQPYTVKNADGTSETKYMSPSLVTTEPVDSGPLLEVKDNFERQLRRAFRQEHTFQTGSSQQSAVALIQQRSMFLIHLLQTKPAVEDALSWLQTTIWCFALYLSGHADEIDAFLKNFRATAQVKPYTGPLTPEEVRVVVEMVQARLMPRETAAGLLGQDDLDAFTAAINREDANNPELMLLRLKVRAELLAAGMTPIDAGIAAGLGEETAGSLTTAVLPVVATSVEVIK